MQAGRRKTVVLGTGGTIAGTASDALDHLGYTAAQLGVGELLRALPEAKGTSNIFEQVAQIDSRNMSFETWRQLACRCVHWLGEEDVAGIVVTHGTDTLEETAFFLQRVLAPAKPVVLTCAMRPATALSADGPQNLVDALTIAASPAARGVVVACAGVMHSAWDIAKTHTYRLDPFSSGDAGAIGFIEHGHLRMVRNWPTAHAQHVPVAIEKIAARSSWPRVEIVTSYAGASGAVVRALRSQGVDGIVLAGTGNGTMTDELREALLQAQSEGVRVVRASRCANGYVLSDGDDGLPHSMGLSAVKARVALMLELLR